MNEVLPQYDVNSTTWFYLSLLLIVAIYFRFTRFWSLRNLDLALLLAFSPALLFLESTPTVGNAWLFAASGVLLLRLFCDGLFPRRPRMEQNLNSPGLTFLLICALVFLGMRVATEPLASSTLNTAGRSEKLLNRENASGENAEAGPAGSLISAVGVLTEAASPNRSQDDDGMRHAAIVTTRVMAVLAHLSIVVALFLLGVKLFSDAHAGLAMALLYLLLPCTFYQASEVIHVLPSALILWALFAWRKPMVSGGLLGLACGTLFFPIFLLPVWASFYGRKHWLRFLGSWAIVGCLLLASVAFTSADAASFTHHVLGTINWSILAFHTQEANGFWSAQNAVYRLPVCVAFFAALVFMTIWPRKKSLEYLISASTAIIVATQFWFPQQGGVYLLWYLPLMLVVVFRPRLAICAPTDAPKTADPKTASPSVNDPPKLVGSGSPPRAIFQ